MWIERKIPFEEYKNKQLYLPFPEELEKILSAHPELVEFVVHPHDDMVDVMMCGDIYYVITKRQYHLLVDDE